MKVVIIDYSAGNTRSVALAIERLGERALISSERDEIRSASHVILPGVGNASSAMEELSRRELPSVIKSLRIPILGICLGYQLLYRESEEGNARCMEVFDQKVIRFKGGKKVPHVGWSRAEALKGGLFKGLNGPAWFYFVHSYIAPLSKDSTSFCEYGQTFSSSAEKDNFFGVQFHPEKSGDAGSIVLRNFLKI